MNPTARNVSLVALFWLATTAFLVVAELFVSSFRSPEERVWLSITTLPDLAKTVILAAWAYFVGRISRVVFLGPNARAFACYAIAALPLWIFVLRGGTFPANYANGGWFVETLVFMAIPVFAFVFALRSEKPQ